ncbi:hypothetical protein FA95DRAFT_1674891 [Auriscalpium vulgare]|uniref:Uncharacterized protein n=1 Tax=Auriscalpium vulgare TaxID=40419 RepID=A0ACB8S9R3_9AGAM|nr:hypothetical protein FA95DRAFT_1674891 [Auriscalpium vulgare]
MDPYSGGTFRHSPLFRLTFATVPPNSGVISLLCSDDAHAAPQVLMNLQLYMVNSINYLVDFHHKRSYKASTDPASGKFDMANLDALSETGSDSNPSSVENVAREEDVIVSPFVFMDVACRLILELAGGGE